jgi:dihydroorotate dehydrogenase
MEDPFGLHRSAARRYVHARPEFHPLRVTREAPILYSLARSALFTLPAETAHEVVLEGLASLPLPARRALRWINEVDDPRLRSTVCGIEFPNPVGLAAGFDKSASAFNGLGALGFGFVEIGTVTANGQPGNPRPRVFRLPADSALLNRMGFNNPGAEAVAARLARTPIERIVGINIGKSKVTPLEHAVDDYVTSLELLQPFARYVVVNVSSPNTPGLRELQDAGPLRDLLLAVVARARKPGTTGVPVFVKIAPDLSDEQVDQVVDIAHDTGAAGIIATNTTVRREGLLTRNMEALGPGGISGSPLRARAHELVARIHGRSQGNLAIIGVGGIMTPRDAWERICAGANLIQLYTGLIYEGPGIVKRINRGLLGFLDRAGMGNIREAVGSGEV